MPIYKNGVKISASDLRKNDVAIYSDGAIRVCDTRVSVFYEACEPTPSAPTSITVLGGTKFAVLPTAMDSVAKFKPGQTMTLLLTADGQVAVHRRRPGQRRGSRQRRQGPDALRRLHAGPQRAAPRRAWTAGPSASAPPPGTS